MANFKLSTLVLLCFVAFQVVQICSVQSAPVKSLQGNHSCNDLLCNSIGISAKHLEFICCMSRNHCCSHEHQPKTTENMTVLDLKDPKHNDLPDHSVSIFSLGLAATIGVIFSVCFVTISLFISVRYCYLFRNGQYFAPANGMPTVRRTVVFVPLRNSRGGSHVRVTITNGRASAVRYSVPRRHRRDTNPSEDPPRYEDINTVSVPSTDHDAPQPIVPMLPTYDESARI